MNNTVKDFISLMMKGAGLRNEATLSAAPDWKGIYALAQQHTVVGIVGNVVPEGEQQRYFDDAMAIIKRNRDTNILMAQVVTALQQAGLHPLVLKGQGLAQLYPVPLLRMCGDIDLLISAEEYEAAKALMGGIATEEKEELAVDRHKQYFFGAFSVELHASEFNELSPEAMLLFSQLLQDEVFSPEGRCQWQHFECEGVQIPVPPVSFNAFYLFLHLTKHLYTYGVGLRQLVDFMLFIRHNRESIDFPLVRSWARACDLEGAWMAMLNAEHDTDSPLWRTILSQGNFQMCEPNCQSRNYLLRIIEALRCDYHNALRYKLHSTPLFLRHLVCNIFMRIHGAVYGRIKKKIISSVAKGS